jgi:xylose isomerase
MLPEIKQIIYSKCANLEITQRLLQIANSSTWLDDLINLVIELDSGFNEDVNALILKFKDDIEDLKEKEKDHKTEIEQLKNVLKVIRSSISQYV